MQSRKVSVDLIFGRNLEILKLSFSLKGLNPSNDIVWDNPCSPIPKGLPFARSSNHTAAGQLK